MLFGKKKQKSKSTTPQPSEVLNVVPDWETLLNLSISDLDSELTAHPLWLAQLSDRNMEPEWEEFEARLTTVQKWRRIATLSNAEFYQRVIMGGWGHPGQLFDELKGNPHLSDSENQLLEDQVANALLDLPSEDFLSAMRNDGLDNRWTDVLYANGNDNFIARLIQKNNEAGKLQNLEETRKCMVNFLDENPGLMIHADGLLLWARANENRANMLTELRDDDEALRKYLVVNEDQKFLELWRMSQIQVLRDFEENPKEVFRSESARPRRKRKKKRKSKKSRAPGLATIKSHRGSLDELFIERDPEEISRRRSIHVDSPVTRSREGSKFSKASRGSLARRRKRSSKASWN